MIGMRGTPGAGLMSKLPCDVTTIFAAGVAEVTMPGRSLVRIESPFKSVPVMMLNGVPEVATMNGEKVTLCGSEKLPPINSRFRVSKLARP